MRIDSNNSPFSHINLIAICCLSFRLNKWFPINLGRRNVINTFFATLSIIGQVLCGSHKKTSTHSLCNGTHIKFAQQRSCGKEHAKSVGSTHLLGFDSFYLLLNFS